MSSQLPLMRRWTAADYDEALALCPPEFRDAVTISRDMEIARFFGYEVSPHIPPGPSWSAEPDCVVTPWYRKNDRDCWKCLRCIGMNDMKEHMADWFTANFPFDKEK